jgi:hypothetical protein
MAATWLLVEIELGQALSKVLSEEGWPSSHSKAGNERA